MKKIIKKAVALLSTAVIAITASSGLLSANAAVTLPQPLSAWNMTEGSGDKAIDQGKLKNNAYFGDNTGWMDDFEGKFGKVITPGIVVADNSKGQYNMGENFTFAAWVYVSEMSIGSWSFLADNYADEPMTEKDYSPSTWTILINTKGNVCVESQGSWGQINQIVAKYDMTKDGEKWRHVAVTFDKKSLTFKIYIDGTDMSPYTYINNQIVNPTVVSKAIAPPTDKHRLRLMARDPQTHKLKGRMAMVRIYDQTLTQEQVKLLRKQTNGAATDLGANTANTSSKATQASSQKAASATGGNHSGNAPAESIASVADINTLSSVAGNIPDGTTESTGSSEDTAVVDNTEEGPISAGVLIAIIAVASLLIIGIIIAIIILLKKPKKAE